MPLDHTMATAHPAGAPQTPVPAPAPVHVPDDHHADPPTLLTAHGCWYPAADPTGEHVAFICDRAGVPQLWCGPARSAEAHVLDADPDPVTEVSWSPDGRWIAYTSAPGGGEHTRVLVVRPDGTDRRVLAGAEAGGSAHLGCWSRDGSALAVTVAWSPGAAAEHTGPGHLSQDAAGELATSAAAGAAPTAAWTERGGAATLLGGGTARTPRRGTAPSGGLAAYLVDPDGTNAPVLLFSETGAASLRVCDTSADGRLALVRRGPRGHREALVLDTASGRTTFALRVADGDPWIGRFSPDARSLWLRSDAEREFAALLTVRLDEDGTSRGTSVAAERPGTALDLLALPDHGRWGLLAWNVHGASELESLALPATDAGGDSTPPHGPDLPHEVVTRMAVVGGGTVFAALSGSQRRPGIWELAGAPLRTPCTARDDEAA
ncbi:S9 family peptidase, partial [Streptomyces sp. NPDC031705]